MKKKLKEEKIVKSLKMKYSGRSSDYIPASFIFGCAYKCVYCSCRRHIPEGFRIALNYTDIIDSIDNHVESLPWPKTPNQTHQDYYTYDIGCNTDVPLMWKYLKDMNIFEYFIEHDKAFATFATKNVNYDLLKINPQKKVRIRFSLMPQELSTILEPNTSLIIDRIQAINKFYDAGYDVHINYSPIIAYKGVQELYENLFKLIDLHIRDDIKPHVKAECIFLTHNKKLHDYNIENNISGEDLLWNPELQETKTSSYGSENLRYNYKIKRKLVTHYQKLIKKHLPWQEIRYIF